MNYEIVPLDEFSGTKATIYSPLMEGEEFTLFDYFVEENQNAFRVEVKFILDRLETMGQMYGAREDYFKLHEGRSGDGVSALYDLPGKELRLFCIRYGRDISKSCG